MVNENIQRNKLHVLGKLTASLIHDIRNPLSAIKLNLELLQMIQNELPDEANESVEASLDALKRIQSLVDDVLTFSRKNRSEQKLHSINAITQNALEILQGEERKFNVTVIKNLDENLPLGYFDKSKLLQVFLNLITNALEACKSGDRIVIRTYQDEDFYLIWEIEDSGEGIGEENIEKIFSDFYTSKEKGTGLGLSVCKLLLKEYQADLLVKSKVGEGSVFTIRFNPNLMQVKDAI